MLKHSPSKLLRILFGSGHQLLSLTDPDGDYNSALWLQIAEREHNYNRQQRQFKNTLLDSNEG